LASVFPCRWISSSMLPPRCRFSVRVGQIPCWSGSSLSQQRAPFPVPAQDLFRAAGPLPSFQFSCAGQNYSLSHPALAHLRSERHFSFLCRSSRSFFFDSHCPKSVFLVSNWVPLAFPTDFQISDFVLDFAVLGLESRVLLISCFVHGPVHREITARQHF
jgi:hypothetical protein